MACGGMPIASTPFTRIDPARRPTSPSTDFSVEVRPAPLRPSSVTTSPLRTERSTPCSTCDSPYQAFSPAISSTALPLAIAGAHVRFLDLGIFGDLGVRSLGEDRAALQHGDPVRDARHDAHVVLDHQHRAALRDLADQLRDAIDVLVAHSGGTRLRPQHMPG